MKLIHRDDVAPGAFDVQVNDLLTLELRVDPSGERVYFYGVNGSLVTGLDGVRLPDDNFTSWVRERA